MDPRSFLVGALCGAFIAVAAGWILAGSDDEEVATQSGPEPMATTVTEMISARRPETPPSKPGASSSVADLPGKPNIGERSNNGTVTWPASQWQELEQEPKDDSWAYYMEQTLLQYLASHASSAMFDVSRIECRTTVCQLEVVGYDASTEPVWQQVMYDVRQQPWSDFGAYATSNANIDGRFVLLGTLRRAP